jgi:hypothetical protein
MRQSVSVAMAVYNGIPYLQTQMASVLSELRPQDELIVVDDHSTDGSLAWLQGLKDSRIILLPNERNLGVRGSFERALSACTKPIILLCDQDDVWVTGKRDALEQAFEDPLCSVALSDAEVIDADGMILSHSFMTDRGGFSGGRWETLAKNRYLGCCMALRRDIVELGLPIPAAVPMHDMWFGLLAVSRGQVSYLPERYLQYRRHGRNVSPSRRAGLMQMLRWRWNLLFAVRRRLAERPANRATGSGEGHGDAATR